MCMLFLGKTQAFIGSDPGFRDGHYFSRLHIPDKLGPDGLQSTGFGSQDISIVPLTDA